MHNCLETGGFRKTIDTVIRFTDTSCIDSARWNLLIFDVLVFYIVGFTFFFLKRRCVSFFAHFKCFFLPKSYSVVIVVREVKQVQKGKCHAGGYDLKVLRRTVNELPISGPATMYFLNNSLCDKQF